MKKYDFKKEWPKLKKELVKLSKGAKVLVKKGEKELVKLSQEGKIQIDLAAATLKKEHLFHLIGKEYVKAKTPGKKSAQMTKQLAELKKVNVLIRALKRARKSPKK